MAEDLALNGNRTRALRDIFLKVLSCANEDGKVFSLLVRDTSMGRRPFLFALCCVDN
jgi:hypothetical protein